MVLYSNSKYNRILFQITHCYCYNTIGRVKGSKSPSAKLRAPPDKIFGVGKPLKVNKLPLVNEVGSALAFEAEQDRLERGSNEIRSNEATDTVVKKVLNVYQAASIPTIAKKQSQGKCS